MADDRFNGLETFKNGSVDQLALRQLHSGGDSFIQRQPTSFVRKAGQNSLAGKRIPQKKSVTDAYLDEYSELKRSTRELNRIMAKVRKFQNKKKEKPDFCCNKVDTNKNSIKQEDEQERIDKIKLLFKNAPEGAPKTTYSNSVLKAGHSVRARYAPLFNATRPGSQMTLNRSDMGKLNLFNDGLSDNSGKQVNLVVNKHGQQRSRQRQRLQYPQNTDLTHDYNDAGRVDFRQSNSRNRGAVSMEGSRMALGVAHVGSAEIEYKQDSASPDNEGSPSALIRTDDRSNWSSN